MATTRTTMTLGYNTQPNFLPFCLPGTMLRASCLTLEINEFRFLDFHLITSKFIYCQVPCLTQRIYYNSLPCDICTCYSQRCLCHQSNACTCLNHELRTMWAGSRACPRAIMSCLPLIYPSFAGRAWERGYYK